MIKSPLRYPGGKSRAVKTILPLIPYFDEYREPFLGGGSVFLAIKQKNPNKKFWINDLYYELYTFWKIAQKTPEALVKKIYELRNKFTKGKDLYKFLNDNLKDFDDLERASAFFIYNRITFSGTSLSGGYSEAAFKGRFTESSIQRVLSFAPLLQNTKITNFDYEILVKEKGENVFIYLDPPYYSATKSALYGKNGELHKSFDHERFAKLMQKSPHKWLITYDDCEYIRSLFSFAHIANWNLTYGMRNVLESSSQIGNELLISNFKIKTEVTEQYSLFEFEKAFDR